MKKEFLEAGKIVGTHGVKGMVRIQPWADDVGFLCAFKRFFISEKKTETKICEIRPNGRVVIAKLSGVDSVESAEALRGYTVYIKREDANIQDGRYFVDELIGCNVFDANENALLGVISDVSETGANDVWHIKKDGKEYLVPAIESVIVSVDVENEVVKINVLEGIFDAD